MYLGDLRIAGEEIERIGWEEGELTLDVGWPLEDVPVLLDLPREPLLRWHEDDAAAGIAVKLGWWRYDPDAAQLGLSLRLHPEGLAATIG